MRASAFSAAPAFVTSPRRSASMNARTRVSSPSSSPSPSLSLSPLPTSWSPSSRPVCTARRSAPLELGSTDVPSEVDGVVDGTCVPYACVSRSDLNLD